MGERKDDFIAFGFDKNGPDEIRLFCEVKAGPLKIFELQSYKFFPNENMKGAVGIFI